MGEIVDDFSSSFSNTVMMRLATCLNTCTTLELERRGKSRRLMRDDKKVRKELVGGSGPQVQNQKGNCGS